MNQSNWSRSIKARYWPEKDEKRDLKSDQDMKRYCDEGILDHLLKVLIFILGVTTYINHPVIGSRPRLTQPHLVAEIVPNGGIYIYIYLE